MKLRRAIAEWLYPEAFRQAQSYERLRWTAWDAHWWLGEYPQAAAALRWLIDNDRNYHRAAGEPATGPWPYHIADFREALRRRAALTDGERDG